MLALSESTDHLIVCNGYKDEEFMRLALMGQKLGHKVFIVIEQVSELDVLLQAADEMGVVPDRRRAHQAVHRGVGALGAVGRREVEVRASTRRSWWRSSSACAPPGGSTS